MPNQESTELLGEDDEPFTITTTKFEPVVQYRLLAKIGRVLIPAVMAAKGDGAKNPDGSTAVNMRAGVEALFEKLTPEVADMAMMDSLAATSVIRADDAGAKEVISLINVKGINRAFRGGNLRVMLQAMQFALEVNYGRFFVGALKAKQATAAIEATPTQSP